MDLVKLLHSLLFLLHLLGLDVVDLVRFGLVHGIKSLSERFQKRVH